jgi:hypothetical protein
MSENGITNIPGELVHAISYFLSSMKDMFSLHITCKFLNSWTDKILDDMYNEVFSRLYFVCHFSHLINCDYCVALPVFKCTRQVDYIENIVFTANRTCCKKCNTPLDFNSRDWTYHSISKENTRKYRVNLSNILINYIREIVEDKRGLGYSSTFTKVKAKRAIKYIFYIYSLM